MSRTAQAGGVPQDKAAARIPAGLVRAAQQGDRRAVERLFTRLHPLVLDWCEPEAGQDAADVAQEVLLKVHRALPRLRRPDLLVYWARLIAQRELAAHGARRAQPRPEPEPRESAGYQTMETRYEICDQLCRLSPEHARILMLRYVFGCDERTAAVAAGVSLGTAKSRLHRARVMFRRGWETQPTP